MQKSRIPDYCSILTAKAKAIESSLEWCLSEKINKAVILSDSKSVLQSLENHATKKYNHHLIINIRSLLCNSSKKNIKVDFIWTKGHAGIRGNEIVDSAAKQATLLSEIEDVFAYDDIINFFKTQMSTDWKNLWNVYVSTSNNHYVDIHPTRPTKIDHIFLYNISRSYSTTITRMKLNHGCFPAHLFRIGINETPTCECDNLTIGDLNHIFFNCSKHKNNSDKFMKKLVSLKVNLPTNISTLLSTFNKDIYDEINCFLKKSDINI